MKTISKTTGNGHKPAREAAQAGLQLLPLIMNNIPQAVFWKNRDLVYLGCNQAFADDAGFSSPDEIIGKTDFDMPWRDQADLYREDDQSVMESGESKLNYEEPQTTPDGSTIWLSTSKIPIREDGQVVAVLGMYEDITARKQAEQTLQDTEARYSAVVNQAGEGIIIIQDNSCQFVNQALADMLGYSPEEMQDTPFINYVALESKTLLAERVKARLAGEEVPLVYEAKLLRKDGTIIDAELSAGVIEYRGKSADVGLIRDITERKRMETAIKAEQKRFETILETIRVPTIISRVSDGIVLYANQATAQVSNLHLDKLVGFKTLNFYVNPADQKKVLETIHQDGYINDFEVQMQRSDGSLFWALLSSRIIDYQNDKCVLTSYVDITSLKQMEQEIKTAFERRGRQVQLSTQVSQSIAAATNLEELYQRVVAQVKEQFGYYHAQLLRYDAAQNAVVLITGYGETGAKMLATGHRLPMGEGLIGAAAASGETVLRPVLENDPDWHANPLLPETKGEIAVPIKLGDSILGVLDVQSNVAGALVADDQLLLEGLCGQIATAMESTRLRLEMAERLEEINRLYRAMSHEGWQTYRETPDVPEGFVFDQSGLKPVESAGLAEELFSSVPLTVPGGEVVGTLSVADDPQRPLSPDEEALLQLVSEQVALALESARLFEQTQSALNESKEAEEVVRASEAKLSEALDIAKLANWEYDVDRDRFSFNDHFYSIFHTTVEQMGGYELSSAQYAQRLVHPEDVPLVGAAIEKALASTDKHYSTNLEHRVIYADGGIGYISVEVHIDRDDQGKIIRYYGANQDITERKLAEEAVAKRASELQTVAEVSTTTAKTLEPDQLLQTVVDVTKERFGIYHAHVYLADESWNTLLLAAGAGEVGRQMVATGHTIKMDMEKSLVARAARERQAVIVNNVHDDPAFLPNPLLPETRSEMALPMIVGEKVLGVFDVQSDKQNGFTKEDANIYTTLAAQVAIALQNARLYVEQAATVTQLRELDKLKTSFLANMSHELRTPLNSILGFSDVIIEEVDGPLTDNMRNDLGLIQKNGQHLLHLINDVLDMAKIEAGRMNLSMEKFKVHEILEEVTSITSTLASEKNLALFIEKDSDDEVEITADRTRIRQVMINIVNNAIKFTDKGKIALRVTKRDQKVLIAVQDTGIGISSDKLEAIFQEFTQVDSSSTRKSGGTGLGLPISRRLVELHGGRLWAASNGVDGEGSTFFVELYLEPQLTEPAEKTEK